MYEKIAVAKLLKGRYIYTSRLSKMEGEEEEDDEEE